jgi:phytoene synthase
LNSQYSENYFALAASVAGRATHFYSLARKTLPAEDRKSMVAAELMGSVYWQLLEKLAANRFNVFGPQPVRLTKPHKLALIFKSWLRFATGSTRSNYGTP